MTDTDTGTAVAVRADQEQPPRMSRGQFLVGATPKAIVPVDFDGAWRIANITFKSGMAPKGFKSAEQCMVAILHGLEVGFTPMNALQSIAVINGRPTIWGDGALGLIEASGLLTEKAEFFEGTGDGYKAVCILERKGRKSAIRQEFSMADARKAGLLGKEGPWQTYPPRMLQMRARSWAMRDGFSDVLKGLHIREEVMDYVDNAPSIAPREEPIDDGGGPPVPPSAQIAKQEAPAAAQVEHKAEVPAMFGGATEDAEFEEVEEKKRDPISTGPSGFPGDTAMPDIPANLRRAQPKPVLTDDERDWLEGLKGAFSGCEDMEALLLEVDRLMKPAKEKVSVAAYKLASDLMDVEIERINGDQ